MTIPFWHFSNTDIYSELKQTNNNLLNDNKTSYGQNNIKKYLTYWL